MHKKAPLAAIVLWLFTLPLLAQQVAPADGPLASREDIIKLLDVVQTKKQLEFVRDNIVSQIKEMSKQALESRQVKLTVQQLAELDQYTAELFKQAFSDDLLEDIIPIYQRHFTKADIQNVIAFYSTPAGHKFIEEGPAILTESMQVSSSRMQRKMRDLMLKVDQRVEQLSAHSAEQPKARSGSQRKSPAKSK